ncbi:endonuclease/exonuclease/phosphatase family protein [Flavobacteriales bacterium]|nr:endonuclease/exonuclease/phosphatase family protein [Flavobacteriales bacterium]
MNKIIFLLLISLQLLNAQSLKDLHFGTDSTFEVVSWNIEWFPKNGQVTADSVKIIIQSLAADVYALQEIDDTTLLKQVVSTIPGYACHFKFSHYGGLAYVYNTNTVQVNAKYEIYTSQPYWNAFPRSPQVLELTFNNEDYVIVDNHLKCCGDGVLDLNDTSDEENRRLRAINLLKTYVDSVFSNDKVIVVGDWNDILTDPNSNNVFNSFLNDSDYLFVDFPIALGSSANFSFPTWPSHLDHILISDELFAVFSKPNSELSCIRIDDYMSSWSAYDYNISDHRPVGLKLEVDAVISTIHNLENSNKNLIKIVDVLGRETKPKNNTPLFYMYDDASVEKKIVVE